MLINSNILKKHNQIKKVELEIEYHLEEQHIDLLDFF